MSCGCIQLQEKYEFPIIEEINNITNVINVTEGCPDGLCELKQKIICEFLDIINKLQCGIQPDLELLLEEISIVYIYE